MIVADTSVWIDFFNGKDTLVCAALESLLENGSPDLLMLDVVLMEFLRGFQSDDQLRTANELLAPIPVVSTGGEALAREAAHIYRALRKKGITVRSPVDLLVGAWCIGNDAALLHNDRDYAGMVRYHGLNSWLPDVGPAH